MSKKPETGCMAIYPTLGVPNVSEAAEFYQEKLGFELSFLYGEPPTHGAVQLDKATVHFYNGQTQVEGFWLYFQVENVDELFDWYAGNGIDLLDKPTTQPWGMREINLRDLNGYRLRFGQSDMTFGDPVPVVRIELNTKIEKRLAAMLTDLADYKQMSVTEVLEETLLHSFEAAPGQAGRTVASPHTKRQMKFIDDLKQKHGVDYDTHDSYRFIEKADPSSSDQ